MEKRSLDNLGVEISLLGFGFMRFPTKDGKIDKDLSEKMVDYAVMQGVNYLDTAYIYHGGESEVFLGEVIKKYDRQKLYLANKMPLWECKSKEDVDKIFNEQLERMKVDYIDFYLIHAVNKERIKQIKDWDVMKTLEKYREEGKIKFIGFSFHDDLDCFKEAVDLYDWDFVQIQLNYMDVDIQQGIEGYKILEEKKIPAIVMEPIKGGSLANFNSQIEGILTNHNKDASIASWALRWVGSLPNVKIILSGMSTLEQVIDNINTFTDFQPISKEEETLINEVRKGLKSLIRVSCTKCNYCMPCPAGVHIPDNFFMYNEFSMYQNQGLAQWKYNDLNNRKAYASLCVDCKECVEVCPQKIDIPYEMQKLQNFLKENGIV